MSKILIGIDPGVNTGIAISYNGKFNVIESTDIIQAFKWIESTCHVFSFLGCPIRIYMEDSRKRKWFGENSSSKIMGAGSIKRDCTMWEGILKKIESECQDFQYFLIDPKDQKGLTKWSAEEFKKKTGWQERTNEHGRDAALLIFGR